MKVSLVSHSVKPLDSICLAIAIMKEKDPIKYVESLTIENKESMIREILKSRLTGALEFASFEFLLEDVTRAFTHQLVRHRTFHFSQQSLRFYDASDSGFKMPKVDEFSQALIKSSVATVNSTYRQLLKHGCPAEDARSILPTNVHTKIMFGATLRGLIELAEVRLCLQTQEEFQSIMRQIKQEMTKVSSFLGSLLIMACERSGYCEFKSIYDRECPIENERRRR